MGVLPRVIQGARRPDPPPPPDSGAERGAADNMEIDVDVEERSPRIAPPSRPPPPRLPAISTLGRYEILGRVAYGGMAEIFLARETSKVGAARLLAIKRILPHVASDSDFVRMFFDEARLAIQLNHPNICHVYEFGEVDGSYFLAMEWIHGVSLTKLIRRARASGGLPPELAARIIASVADALHYAHRARDVNGVRMGIVHRDVSPQNIMINYDGQVKLLDFGIAKAASHSTKTEAGTIKGKLAYMSPQQCLGRPLDGRADVFALGVCLFEALTGQSLFRRETEYETIRAIIDEPTPSLRQRAPGMSPDLDAIIQRSVMKDPADRYSTAAEMQADLERWIASSGKIVTAEMIAAILEDLFPDQVLSGPSLEPVPLGQSTHRRAHDSVLGLASASELRDAAADLVPSAALPAPRLAHTGVAVPVVVGSTAIVQSAGAPTRARAGPTLARVLGGGAALAAVGVLVWLALRPGQVEPAVIPNVAASAVTQLAAPAVAERERAVVMPAEPALPEPSATAAPEPAVIVAAPSEPGATAEPTASDVTAPAPADPSSRVASAPTAPVPPVPRGRDSRSSREAERASSSATGQLSINTRPWSQVFLRNRLLGSTPIAEVTAPAGDIRLRFVDESGASHVRTVHVEPNGETRVFFELPQGGE
nr:Serine/threonine protein kinase [Sandaracinus sp.]